MAAKSWQLVVLLTTNGSCGTFPPEELRPGMNGLAEGMAGRDAAEQRLQRCASPRFGFGQDRGFFVSGVRFRPSGDGRHQA